jgi:hypothetical protein
MAQLVKRDIRLHSMKILPLGSLCFFLATTLTRGRTSMCWTNGSPQGEWACRRRDGMAYHISPNTNIIIILFRLADAVAMHQQSAAVSAKQLPFAESAKIAEEQLKIMDLGFSEIVRQVAVQCSQRAELMDRMWRASHELYDALLMEMSSVIDGLRYSATDWKEKCELVRG